MNPTPAAVDIEFPLKLRIDPVPIFRVLTFPPVPKEPDAALKVTFAPLAKVIFPTLPVPQPVKA
jgi:hypothetical protein